MGMLRLGVTEEFLCDFARPRKDMLRICATQRRYVAIMANQIRYIAFLCGRNKCATLRDPKQICCDFVRTKKGILRQLRLEMSMLRLCATKMNAALCATQNIYVPTLCEPKKVCCDHCDSKGVCCHFARPKCLRGFARPKKIDLALSLSSPNILIKNLYLH